MNAVRKYELQVVDFQQVGVPAGSKILSCQMQHTRGPEFDKLMLWVLVEEPQLGDLPRDGEVLNIHICGTGPPIHNADKLHYISTVQSQGFVGHVFQKLS